MLAEVMRSIAREYRWPGYTPAPLQRAALSESDAASFPGRYELESHDIVSIRRAGDGFEVVDLNSGWQPLVSVAGGTLAGDGDRRP